MHTHTRKTYTYVVHVKHTYVYRLAQLNGDALWDMRHCVDIPECTYADLEGTAYHTPRLYGPAYHSQAKSLYSTLLYETT